MHNLGRVARGDLRTFEVPQDLADDEAMDDSLRSIASEAITIANDRVLDQDS